MRTPTFQECPAGCGRRIRTTLLLCAHHWFQVPADLRDEVTSTWSRYQKGTIGLEELREVQARAIATVSPATDTHRPRTDDTVKGGAL